MSTARVAPSREFRKSSKMSRSLLSDAWALLYKSIVARRESRRFRWVDSSMKSCSVFWDWPVVDSPGDTSSVSDAICTDELRARLTRVLRSDARVA